jgi:hypothetical protein
MADAQTRRRTQERPSGRLQTKPVRHTRDIRAHNKEHLDTDGGRTAVDTQDAVRGSTSNRQLNSSTLVQENDAVRVQYLAAHHSAQKHAAWISPSPRSMTWPPVYADARKDA